MNWYQALKASKDACAFYGEPNEDDNCEAMVLLEGGLFAACAGNEWEHFLESVGTVAEYLSQRNVDANSGWRSTFEIVEGVTSNA